VSPASNPVDAAPQAGLGSLFTPKLPGLALDLAQIEAILAGIPDPEIPVVSIRELGILRDVKLSDHGVEVVITPTYSGCPAMEQIRDDVVSALAAHQIQGHVTLQLAPAWTTDWMTPAARDKLRAYGIAPPDSAADGQCAPGHEAGARPIRFTPDLVANYAHSTRANGLFGPQNSVKCPQCGSPDTTETSHFGSTACKALYKCLACLEPFDYFKPY
jgi:ring-1,2-phenylacetyl-CoA epoxidase subunit PaaD